MGHLAAGLFNKWVSNIPYDVNWPSGSVAMIPYSKADKTLLELIDRGVIRIKPIEDFFPNFDIERHKAQRLIVHVGNGIGDVFALSALAKFLEGTPLQVHIGNKFHPVFEWFDRSDITLKGYFDPIATGYLGGENRKTKYWYRLAIEDAAVKYGTGCWFEAHFKRVGQMITPNGYDRPRLKRNRIWPEKSDIRQQNSVLISHRSSCQMRSSRFEDFYYPVRNAIPGAKIYVHEIDLTPDDIRFVKDKKSINVIRKGDIRAFLLNLYDASLVVSTDTSAIHFREGIGKPGLAVYGAMSAASRTKGYVYTRGIDVRTGCPHQPCVKHERVKGEVCDNADPGDLFARCQSGPVFQEQLFNELKSLING